MSKHRIALAVLTIVTVIMLGLAGCSKSSHEHPNSEHPTNEHPASEHPTNEHPTNEHPK